MVMRPSVLLLVSTLRGRSLLERGEENWYGCLSDDSDFEEWSTFQNPKRLTDATKYRWKNNRSAHTRGRLLHDTNKAARDKVDTSMSECSSEMRQVENSAWIERVILHPNHSLKHKKSLFVVLGVPVLRERNQRENAPQ